MLSNGYGEGSINNHRLNSHTPLHISTSQKGLLSYSDPENGLQDTKTTLPSRVRLQKFSASGGLPSPSAKFQLLAKEREEFSRSLSAPSEQGLQDRLKRALSKKINWSSLWETSKIWIRSPLNMALLLWISCVAISGAILFLVMTGMLNRAIPVKSQRNTWFEVNNQILNALFTLMCLYQHPKRFYHLVLLCRWKINDIYQLRKIYCKNGTYKPNDWAHMMVVIVLLHVNCLAQYALCGLNLGFKRSERPAIGVALCLSVAITSAAIASVYCIFSPLGKEYVIEVDEEAQDHMLTTKSNCSTSVKSGEEILSFSLKIDKREIENKPEWRGGLFDFWDDITVASLSVFCTFCVFGWNMERLGFGNMYVHIATFLLFCMAPFWIFDLAAVNIDDETVREALGVTGIVLCIFGLLYGGFWRIQMRKRFRLPPTSTFCGEPAVGDCAQWLCCCWCSLAQEVRTADYYDVVKERVFTKRTEENMCSQLSPLPREDGVFNLGTSESPRPSRFLKDHSNANKELPRVEVVVSAIRADEHMKPPLPSVICREEKE